MNIWKGIKSFFSVADESKANLTRKMKHGQRPYAVLTPEEREKQQKDRAEYENDVVRIHNSLNGIATGIDVEETTDAIAFMKSKQVSTTPLTDNEIRYIAKNCDFPLDNNFDVDPRLVEAITFAVNLHAVKTKQRVDEILTKFDNK